MLLSKFPTTSSHAPPHLQHHAHKGSSRNETDKLPSRDHFNRRPQPIPKPVLDSPPNRAPLFPSSIYISFLSSNLHLKLPPLRSPHLLLCLSHPIIHPKLTPTQESLPDGILNDTATASLHPASVFAKALDTRRQD